MRRDMPPPLIHTAVKSAYHLSVPGIMLQPLSNFANLAQLKRGLQLSAIYQVEKFYDS